MKHRKSKENSVHPETEAVHSLHSHVVVEMDTSDSDCENYKKIKTKKRLKKYSDDEGLNENVSHAKKKKSKTEKVLRDGEENNESYKSKMKEKIEMNDLHLSDNVSEAQNDVIKKKKKKKKSISCRQESDEDGASSLNILGKDDNEQSPLLNLKKKKKKRKDKELQLKNNSSTSYSEMIEEQQKSTINVSNHLKNDDASLSDNSDPFIKEMNKYLDEKCLIPSETTTSKKSTMNVGDHSKNKAASLSDNFDPFNKMNKHLHKKSPVPSKTIPVSSKGRHYTLSIALPASIIHDTCLDELIQTYVIGEIARYACIYSVDEIVIYNDKTEENNRYKYLKCVEKMKIVLEYLECPQYLKKYSSFHSCLKHVGTLNPLNPPHHLLFDEWCPYREGIVVSRNNKGDYVDIGYRNPVLVTNKLEKGVRVTLNLPPELEAMRKTSRDLYGYVVSPDDPRTCAGLYWGYTVRVANNLSEVFKSDRFKNGYDLIIGTSDKGTPWQEASFDTFSHALIVFGGVSGIESAMEADESLAHSDPFAVFPHYLNVCPNQSSRTIRTEEAVIISLATLSDKITAKGRKTPLKS